MDFSSLTKTDFAALHCFSKSKSICADASAESRAIHAIWTPQNGGKRGGCVLSRAKILILFRTGAILRKKSFNTIEKNNIEAKQVDFLSNSPYFSPKPRSFSGKGDIRQPSLLAPRSPTRTDTPERTRTHAHRALSEFAFLAFTLHLHPQVVDTVCFVCEGKALFLPSPVKEKGVKPSHASRCSIGSYRRMVKR